MLKNLLEMCIDDFDYAYLILEYLVKKEYSNKKYVNGKYYMRDKFCREYTAEMLEMCNVLGM